MEYLWVFKQSEGVTLVLRKLQLAFFHYFLTLFSQKMDKR